MLIPCPGDCPGLTVARHSCRLLPGACGRRIPRAFWPSPAPRGRHAPPLERRCCARATSTTTMRRPSLSARYDKLLSVAKIRPHRDDKARLRGIAPRIVPDDPAHAPVCTRRSRQPESRAGPGGPLAAWACLAVGAWSQPVITQPAGRRSSIRYLPSALRVCVCDRGLALTNNAIVAEQDASR